MGAVAALLYLARKDIGKNTIAGIFDSPFFDLEDLVEEYSK